MGCGAETRTEADSKREMVSESQTITKEVTVHTPTANGGFITEKTITADTTAGERSTTASKELTRTAPDAATSALIGSGARIAGAAMNAATGGIGLGEGLGVGLAALLTASVTAWGASKSAESKQLRQERDFHKGDADEAYKKLDARL